MAALEVQELKIQPVLRFLPICLVLALPVSISAQTSGFEQSHTLRRDEAGNLQVRSTVMTNSSCYTAGRTVRSPPAGVAVAEKTVTLTLKLLHGGAYACVKSPTPVYFRSRLAVPPGTTDLAIFVKDSRTGEIIRRDLVVPGQ